MRLTAGSDVVQENTYDGLTRRIVKLDYASGVTGETRQYYYSKDWQILNEYVGEVPSP
jgi:hypothetical protein